MFASRQRPHRMAGLTLIELVMFIVIVSTAIAGVLSVLSITVKSSADPQLRKQAIAIAEALLEEIQLSGMTYCDPADPKLEVALNEADCTTQKEVVGPEGSNARPYDNVNDYVTSYSTAKQISGDVTGATAAIPAGYAASVTITPETLGGIASSAASPEVLRIAVTVNYGSDSITLEGYRTRYAPNFMP
jgi:MSHA pilin protein MshD